jgi:hypothetical protein
VGAGKFISYIGWFEGILVNYRYGREVGPRTCWEPVGVDDSKMSLYRAPVNARHESNTIGRWKVASDKLH